MSKLVLDININRELMEDDIIIFKGGKWKIISKNGFIGKELLEQEKKNKNLEERILKLEKDLLKLAKIVKEK